MEQLKSESQSAKHSLTTARTALQLQQEHLQQLQSETQQATSALTQQNACIGFLRQLDTAKQQWALEKNKPADAVPTAEELQPYFKDGVFPSCPAGGMYSINAVNEVPTCSIAGHALGQ